MNKLTVYRGVPACGKSSEAQRLLNSSYGTLAVVERDLIRDNVFGSRNLTGAEEAVVTKISHNMTEAFLKSGLDVIISDCNMRDKYVREFAKIAARVGAQFEQKIFDTPIEECIARDLNRKNGVGEAVIRRMAKNGYPAKVVDVSDIILDVEPYFPSPFASQEAVIFDIDGTVADMGPCGRSPYAWNRVGEDSVREEVIRVAVMYAKSGVKLIFLSGRDGSCEDITRTWLDTHLSGYDYELYMRKAKDNRADSIVKYELFNTHINPRNDIQVVSVFDDRKQVIRIWERMGLTVFNVGLLDEEF